ncbi:MAG: alpha/beta hydrolase [Clostridia bacterium]|nr:alpha/beta hydrolase [Clostridia bacterium]
MIVGICIVLLIFVLLFLIGNLFYALSLNPKIDKSVIFGKKEKTKKEIESEKKASEWIQNNATDEYITSSHNGKLKLHASVIKNKEASTVWTVVIHGYMSSNLSITEFAEHFLKLGYNVIMPDLRGHGKSEGKYIGMGYHERLDVIDWINYILGKNKEAKIVIFGISMGAATTMLTIGEKLPKNVKLAICDCGYTSAWDEFKYQLKRLYKLPAFPVLYFSNFACRIWAKYSFKDASPILAITKSVTPTLFIHGSKDTFVPFEMQDILYNACSSKKEKLVIEGAEHAESHKINSELYFRKIDEFVNKYIDGGENDN